MENVKMSLCPMCDNCPEVEIAEDGERVSTQDIVKACLEFSIADLETLGHRRCSCPRRF